MSDNLTPQQGAPQPGAQQENVQLDFSQNQRDNERPKKKKKKRMNPFLLFLIWVVVIAVIIVLGLVISAWIAPQFNNVFEMIDWIVDQVRTM